VTQSKIHNRKSTILLIGPAANTHVQRWVAALGERGWRVSVISTGPLPPSLPPSLRGVPCFAIPTVTTGMSAPQRLATLLRGWARVPGVIAALRPDIVHVHSLPTPTATLFLRRVPHLVVSAWGSDVVERDGRKARWYPKLLVHATRVTATSHYLADVVRSYLPRQVDIVPFGVDVERFPPAHVAPLDPQIGTLRHLEWNYGIDVLLEALPIIRIITQQTIPTHIGGAGSLAPTLRAQAAALSVGDDVQWHGRVPHEAVPHFLQQLGVFAMPSRAESFGVAALEAQACSVPVVASRVGGLPEVVCHGETGLLVPPEDPRALAEAIAALLVDPQRRGVMGAAARRWVAEHYRWEDSVDMMEDVYRQVH
jgi:glycosyltransferase involved in cell wall biosynthesis